MTQVWAILENPGDAVFTYGPITRVSAAYVSIRSRTSGVVVRRHRPLVVAVGAKGAMIELADKLNALRADHCDALAAARKGHKEAVGRLIVDRGQLPPIGEYE